ncbi:MAG TPA: universal stress protein [Pseudonocardiaceae bacterium]|nr:universal stress protein [Pseudonocardiaceae bacterium]
MNLVGGPIVAGVDGSDSSYDAARWAAVEAARRNLPLRLLYVVHPPADGFAGGTVLSELLESAEAEARREVDELAATFRDSIEVGTEVLVGPAIPLLVDASKDAALMVVGSRGLGGFTGVLVGSVAAALAAHGGCPVAVVRASSSAGSVVVGVDGSPASEAAVALAFEEASLRGVDLVAVHTWRENASDAAFVAAIEPVLDLDQLQREAEETLAERLAGWRENYPDVTVHRAVSRDRPVHALLAAADGASLLVVGSRGRGGFSGLLLGSTSQALVYHAPCPLVVARPIAA